MRNLLTRLFIEPSANTLIQFIRYFIAGGTAFLVDFGTFTILTTCFAFFKDWYLLANVLSFILGLGTSYFLSICWVFRNRTMENRLAEFSVFTIIGLIGLVLNSFFIWIFAEHILAQAAFFPEVLTVSGKMLELKTVISKLIATALVYIWNFGARKIALFK